MAEQLDWDAALVWVDDRFEYREFRMIALVQKTEALYYVAFVERDELRRITNFRLVTRREVKRHVENS